MASRAACRLGLLAGRRLLLFCWATLVSDGKNRLATTAAATQATTTAQRKRTAKRPVAEWRFGGACLGLLHPRIPGRAEG